MDRIRGLRLTYVPYVFRGVRPVLRCDEHDEREDGHHAEGRPSLRGHGLRPSPQQVRNHGKD